MSWIIYWFGCIILLRCLYGDYVVWNVCLVDGRVFVVISGCDMWGKYVIVLFLLCWMKFCNVWKIWYKRMFDWKNWLIDWNFEIEGELIKKLLG